MAPALLPPHSAGRSGPRADGTLSAHRCPGRSDRRRRVRSRRSGASGRRAAARGSGATARAARRAASHRERHRLSARSRAISTGSRRLEETVDQVAAATRRYARRQLTWLRKLKDAVIIDVHERDPAEVADEILALLLIRRTRQGASGPVKTGQVARTGERLPHRRGRRPCRAL